MREWIGRAAFGMVFLTTPEGPRVAHTPFILRDENRLQFHLARGNALTRSLEGATALAVINGPDGYISPRWYDNRDTVPTWDYVALEMEGRVRRMEDEGLEAFLHTVIAKFESRIEGEPWRAEESSAATWSRQIRGIVGFEMEVRAWRPTLKLSQKKSASEREAIAAAQDAQRNSAIAALMRGLA